MEAYRQSDFLMWYREAVMYGMDSWTVPGIREQRDDVMRTSLNGQQFSKLEELDARLVDAVMDHDDDEVPNDLLQDDSTHPLTHWWWHLGKLRAGAYPRYLLPPHLQKIYHPEPLRQAA